MITQSQYFEIEDYLQQECRIIEPTLLEELIDHFMDGIQAIPESEENFAQAFASVKQDFGGKSGVRKIQREWQVNALKLHAKGLLQEMKTYFQKPFWWRTLLGCLFLGGFIFYFNFRFTGWEKPHMLLGGFAGGVSAVLLTAFGLLQKNKADFGFYGLQARNWFSILVPAIIVLYAFFFSVITYFVSLPAFVILFTVFSVLLGTIFFIANHRYSARELYPEHSWY